MKEFRPRNVLVTGGAGFVGSTFVRHLLARDDGIHIVNLDLLTYAGSLENLAQLPSSHRHAFDHGDICDRRRVDRILRDRAIDTIVHFAAASHVDRSISDPEICVRTNVVGTFTLLEAARARWLEELKLFDSACRFIHVSTDEVYGSLGMGDPPFTEASPYAPNSPYAATKASSDHIARAYLQTYGLPVIVTHASNNYGPRQHQEKFIPTVIRACLEDRPIPVYGDGSNRRDWLYVDDHCLALEAVLRRGEIGDRYNIGAGCERSNMEIVDQICDMFDGRRPGQAPHKKLVSQVTDRPGHDWRYALDSSKIRRELGWEPHVTLETGLKRTLDWYESGESGELRVES